jgi:PIN domain nuclease of toxin-antitoxin system
VILLDTHVLIWWVQDAGRLSHSAAAAIEEHGEPLVSPISLWELAVLAQRGRVEIDGGVQRWTRQLLGSGIIGIAGLSATAAVTAAELPNFQGDPADRFIYATALDLRVPLISKDAKIRAYVKERPDVQVIW